MTASGGNQFGAYSCIQPLQSTISPSSRPSTSVFARNPWSQGPPFTYTCADVQPFHRLLGGSSNVSNVASTLVNTGTVDRDGVSNSSLTFSNGGLLFNTQFLAFATAPSVYEGATGVTVSFWINQNVGPTWVPVVVLGDGLYLYMSSTYGACVASGSLLASGSTMCNTYWSYSLANFPVVPVVNAWTHYVFVASAASNTYSLNQNGVLEQQGVAVIKVGVDLTPGQ
jgi:hypothetical protein